MNIKDLSHNVDTLLELNEEYESTIKDLFKRIEKLEKTINEKDKLLKQADEELKKRAKND